jgi:NADPH:quinone reductase-like Zn-dependent oxidoreductase
MKSAQIIRYGNTSEVIEIRQTSTPNLSAGNVIVEVKAAGINPIDWKIREGYMQQMIRLQFPSTLGLDFSGVVKQVGEDVSSDFSQGDEVYGQAGIPSGGSGAFSEIALASATSIAHKPKTLGRIEAAALPLVGVSAWQALVEHMALSNGQKILIHGGAGGIGSIAIQLAKNLGSHVATTVSTDDKQFVQDLGADEIIDYRTQTFEDIVHDYDAVFDTVGGETYTRSFKVLRKGGIIVSMLEQQNSELMEQFGVKAVSQFTQVNRERLSKLAEWVDQNKVKVNVEKTYSLDEAGKALDYLRDIHPRGKIVLTI